MLLSNVAMFRRAFHSKYNTHRTSHLHKSKCRLSATEKLSIQVPKIIQPSSVNKSILNNTESLPFKDAGLMFLCNVVAAVALVIFVSGIAGALRNNNDNKMSIYQIENKYLND